MTELNLIIGDQRADINWTFFPPSFSMITLCQYSCIWSSMSCVIHVWHIGLFWPVYFKSPHSMIVCLFCPNANCYLYSFAIDFFEMYCSRYTIPVKFPTWSNRHTFNNRCLSNIVSYCGGLCNLKFVQLETSASPDALVLLR